MERRRLAREAEAQAAPPAGPAFSQHLDSCTLPAPIPELAQPQPSQQQTFPSCHHLHSCTQAATAPEPAQLQLVQQQPSGYARSSVSESPFSAGLAHSQPSGHADCTGAAHTDAAASLTQPGEQEGGWCGDDAHAMTEVSQMPPCSQQESCLPFPSAVSQQQQQPTSLGQGHAEQISMHVDSMDQLHQQAPSGPIAAAVSQQQQQHQEGCQQSVPHEQGRCDVVSFEEGCQQSVPHEQRHCDGVSSEEGCQQSMPHEQGRCDGVSFDVRRMDLFQQQDTCDAFGSFWRSTSGRQAEGPGAAAGAEPGAPTQGPAAEAALGGNGLARIPHVPLQIVLKWRLALLGYSHMQQTQEKTGSLSLPDADTAFGGVLKLKPQSIDKNATLCDSMSASSYGVSQAVL